MASFGERMRRERERRRVSLDDIAAATKIGTRSLRALEQEDFDKLPGGIFNKGFVRAYARYLGMDEEQAISDYMEAAGEPAREDPLDAERLDKLGANWKPPHQDMSDREPMRVPWALLVVLVLLVTVGAGGWKLYHRYKLRKQNAPAALALSTPRAANNATAAAPSTVAAPSAAPGADANGNISASTVPAQQPVEGPSAVTTAKPTPAAANGQAGHLTRTAAPADASATAPGSAQLTLRIHTREKCWVRVTADGKRVVNTNLDADKMVTVPAAKQLILEAGNAGGIDVWFNDKEEPPLGAIGKYAKRTFSAQ